MKKLRLDIELVPSSSWMNNVRAILTVKQWNLLKSQVYDKAWNMCEVCGGAGSKHPVECHEIWAYDDRNQSQKLTGMVALCPPCHRAKHFGLAQMRGKGETALKHFMKVNKLKKSEAEGYIKVAFETWAKRSEKEWKLDLSHLKEYGIEIKEVK
jgi:hypothetical protein